MNPRMIDLAAGRRRILGLSLLAVLGSCGAPEPDAYGNFEATKVVVSAEIGGILLRSIRCGGRPDPCRRSRRVRSTPLVSFCNAMSCVRSSARPGLAPAEAVAQIAVLRPSWRQPALSTHGPCVCTKPRRPPRSSLNQTGGEVRVGGPDRGGRAQRRGSEEVGTVEARIAQADEQIEKSRITNPVSGTVLTTYVEEGEFVQPGGRCTGSPTSRHADLARVREWAQLASVRVGEKWRSGSTRDDRARDGAGRCDLDRLGGRVHADADPDARGANGSGVRGQGSGSPTRRRHQDRHARRVYFSERSSPCAAIREMTGGPTRKAVNVQAVAVEACLRR
jgi:HlyD family secretion protein